MVTAEDVSNKDRRKTMERALEGGLLLVDVRLGGLASGLLSDTAVPAGDVSYIDGEKRVVPFRVRRVSQAEVTADAEWRIEAQIAVDETDEGEETSGWSSKALRAGLRSPRKDARSQRNARRPWTSTKPGLEMQRGESLNDCGYRKTTLACWRWPGACMMRARSRSAGNARSEPLRGRCTPRLPRGPIAGFSVAIVTSWDRSPTLSVMMACARSTLPCAQRWHLIAAHHGYARPLLRTDGAEEPPTRLVQRAQEIALRFVQLDQRWGPWGLAWWEALLRAADQQASRENDLEARRG